MCKFVVDINLVGAELKPSPGRPASPVVLVGRGLSGEGEGGKTLWFARIVFSTLYPKSAPMYRIL